MSIFIRSVPNVMRHFGCSAEDAQQYIDLRDEGYSTTAAALMAGLSDPPDPDLTLARSFAGEDRDYCLQRAVDERGEKR